MKLFYGAGTQVMNNGSGFPDTNLEVNEIGSDSGSEKDGSWQVTTELRASIIEGFREVLNTGGLSETTITANVTAST